MGITAPSGPVVVFGQAPSADYNGERGTSLFDRSFGLLDPRQVFTYTPGQAPGNAVCGWFSGGSLVVVDTVMPTLDDACIVNNYAAGAGTSNLTLVTVDGAGVVVNKSFTRADTGQTFTAPVAIGDDGARQTMGDLGTIQLWNPANCPGRAVIITSSGADGGVTFSVDGFDMYGQPMTENLTGGNPGTATGKKAFKYIYRIRRSGAVAANVKVGTTDIVGLPLVCPLTRFGLLTIQVNNAQVTANTGFVGADATSPATATTGDVRGTYALQTPSNGTLRQIIIQNVPPAFISAATGTSGFLGVQQYSVGTF